jgi:hypothetical protein
VQIRCWLLCSNQNYVKTARDIEVPLKKMNISGILAYFSCVEEIKRGL